VGDIGVRLLSSTEGFFGLALDRVHQFGSQLDPFATLKPVPHQRPQPEKPFVLARIEGPERFADHLDLVAEATTCNLPLDACF
jgi:hypothetical protein